MSDETPIPSLLDSSPPKTELEESRSADTEPPPGDSHGFLEQFETFSSIALEELENVVKQGLTPTERVMLMKVGIKLVALGGNDAKEEDFTPEQTQEVENLLGQLSTS